MHSVEEAINAYVSNGCSTEHELKTINIYSNYTGEKLIQLKVNNALHFKGSVLTQTYYNNKGAKVRQDLEFPHCYYIEIEEGDSNDT